MHAFSSPFISSLGFIAVVNNPYSAVFVSTINSFNSISFAFTAALGTPILSGFNF
jgi:hypothetical protein